MELEKNASSKHSRVLDLPPSCLQFSRKHPDYFIVGTYNLQKESVSTEPPPDDSSDVDTPTEKKSQSRDGSLMLFKIGADIDDELYVVSF
jgi:diphthamide biosynthesis protein 7